MCLLKDPHQEMKVFGNLGGEGGASDNPLPPHPRRGSFGSAPKGFFPFSALGLVVRLAEWVLGYPTHIPAPRPHPCTPMGFLKIWLRPSVRVCA